MQKKNYEKPMFEKVGSIEAVTQSTTTGTRLDSAFANNTLVSQLTLS